MPQLEEDEWPKKDQSTTTEKEHLKDGEESAANKGTWCDYPPPLPADALPTKDGLAVAPAWPCPATSNGAGERAGSSVTPDLLRGPRIRVEILAAANSWAHWPGPSHSG